METNYIDIRSISDLDALYGGEKATHPLIKVIDLASVKGRLRFDTNVTYRLGLYSIFWKKFKGSMRYGRSHYDCNEGSLMFTAPDQVMAPDSDTRPEEGWGLFFHPDLLNRSALGRKINSYAFFHYDSNEALHISDEEKAIIQECIANIKKECARNIDKHTQSLIQTNIELLLNYCERFYDRQFFTRAKVNNDLVQRFEQLLVTHFAQNDLIQTGLPDVKYFASKLNLSPKYLSEMLNKYTGKSTQDHIHLALVNKAKTLLWGTALSISEIAFSLGFEHPSHFTKLFKSKLGTTPKEYRQLN